MYRGIGTPQWVGTNGNQGIGGKWVSGRRINKLRDLLANDSDMEMGQAVVKNGENYGFCDD